RDSQNILRSLLDDFIAANVTLFLEDLGDRDQHFGRRHGYVRLAGHAGVSNSGQHIADWIVDCPTLVLQLLGVDRPYQLDFVTPGSLPVEASSRKQIRQTPNFRM